MERHAADVIIGMMKLFLFFVGILGKMFRWCCPVYIIQRTKNNNNYCNNGRFIAATNYRVTVQSVKQCINCCTQRVTVNRETGDELIFDTT